MFDSTVCLWPIVHTPQMSRKYSTTLSTVHYTPLYDNECKNCTAEFTILFTAGYTLHYKSVYTTKFTVH